MLQDKTDFKLSTFERFIKKSNASIKLHPRFFNKVLLDIRYVVKKFSKYYDLIFIVISWYKRVEIKSISNNYKTTLKQNIKYLFNKKIYTKIYKHFYYYFYFSVLFNFIFTLIQNIIYIFLFTEIKLLLLELIIQFHKRIEKYIYYDSYILLICNN